MDPQKLINGVLNLGAKLYAVVREDGGWIYPERNACIFQDLSVNDGQTIDPTTQRVGDEQYVAVSSTHDRIKRKKLDADGDAGTLWQSHGDDRSSDSQSWGFPRLTLKNRRSHHCMRTFVPTHQ